MPDDGQGQPIAPELLDVLWSRLGPDDADASERRAALRFLRTRRARRRAAAPTMDPQLEALFGLLAIDASDVQGLVPAIDGFLGSRALAGVDREEIPAVFQAYVRAVGRIVAAEAKIARQLIAATPAAEQPAVLAETIDGLLPVAERGFGLVHRLLLLDALVDALTGIDTADGASPLAVAMVDLVGSTGHLRGASPAELQQLVDALFAAGQAATAHRAAHVVKYVGDGLFISGRDALDTADAALDVIAELERELPLRARAGLAWGPVLERAGDVFGLPINVAHIATKSARPGMLLATAEAAALLPADRRGRYRTVELAHPSLGATRVATVRRASATVEPAAPERGA